MARASKPPTFPELLKRSFAGLRASIPAYESAVQREQDQAVLWEPIPNSPQLRAAESPADELFFGGGGGGGKTDLLLGLALTQHRASIIFRSEFAQLKGALGIWERSRQLIGLHGRPNATDFVWHDLPGGRSLEFGGAASTKMMLKYRGRPHDLKGFDELPEMLEEVYLFLGGWLRTNVVGQRTRIVATGNPPTTSEGQWVIRRWAPWLDRNHPHPAADGELRWFVMIDGRDTEVPGPASGWDRPAPIAHVNKAGITELLHPRSRTFIRALVTDNPHYMATGYAQVLESLPEPLRSQMRYGDFDASAEDNPWQIIPTRWVVAAQARWTPVPPVPLTVVGNDPSRGGRDEFVICKRHGHWFGLEVHQGSEAPDGQAGAALLYASVGGDTNMPIQIDIIGTAGSSVYDQARGLGLFAVSMNSSERALRPGFTNKPELDKSKKLGFVNKRAMWWWRLREALDPTSGQDLALPPDPQLRADLCSPRWHPTPRGIQVEPKEDIKERIGRSPDRGEAVVYAAASDYLYARKKPVVAW